MGVKPVYDPGWWGEAEVKDYLSTNWWDAADRETNALLAVIATHDARESRQSSAPPNTFESGAEW